MTKPATRIDILDVADCTDKKGRSYKKLTAHLHKKDGSLSINKNGDVHEQTIMVFNSVLPAFEGQLVPGNTVEMHLIFEKKGGTRAFLPKQAANDDAAAPATVAA